MNIIVGLPPNFEDIDAVFHIRRMGLRKVAICYGGTIYTPVKFDVEPHIIHHESIHGAQQKRVGVEAWWSRYLVDKPFRLEQEIEATRAQLKFAIENGIGRAGRRGLASHLAGVLSSGIYGHMITKSQALREITTNLGD